MSEETKAGRKIIAVVDCTPVIYVWRIAYDRVPILAQGDIFRPHNILTYARSRAWEKTLARRWGVPRGRRGGAA